MTRDSFERIIDEIANNQWIKPIEEQRYLLTPSGESYCKKNPVPPHLNGWKYYSMTKLFWERLSLFIQVTSNLVYKETKYIPIQKNKDIHTWVKACLVGTNISRQEIGNQIFHELLECLDQVDGIQPPVLVFRLTGYQQIGLTAEQTANKLKMDMIDYQLEFNNILHYMIKKISENEKNFPLLSFAVYDIKKANDLTNSTKKTWNLYRRGYSINRIAKERKLKVSTIEDHFVEIALNVKNFSIDEYVDKSQQEKILEVARQEQTRQLKQIKEMLGSVTYFQIRLVLAKYGERQWN
ncbi:helix-turn-helix domain-containing protein [Neobacillus thermocopriae]|uniref:helix-turn-helix domain-containing protein n=1 Tax=Neobacillus thermocopriae TaxID=1215031 RepID=UPI002E201FA0|nr:helix-turn-helix domain-containing protein [Neobacillus thermocopriae]